MTSKTDYWFTIEPYVYINISDKNALLYNTLDGVSIESSKKEVVLLLQDVLLEKNCGVCLLRNERYNQKDIHDFIQELRGKYMGDVISVVLSKDKPVQILPYVNFSINKNKKSDFLKIENLLQTLFEITLHVNCDINVEKLIFFLQSIPNDLTFNIVGNWRKIFHWKELFSFLNRCSWRKCVISSYVDLMVLDKVFQNGFSYKILIDFPVNISQLEKSINLLSVQNLPSEYIFNVSCVEDCQKAEYLVEKYQIKRYYIKPLYNGVNVRFFKENIYLAKDDILSAKLSMKDIFIRHLINVHDFGKINIMSNGDVYANMHYIILGNIFTHSIYGLLQKEIEEGQSWLRTRTETPCNTCVYQYLCPSPSDYEIAIGVSNLCHIV